MGSITVLVLVTIFHFISPAHTSKIGNKTTEHSTGNNSDDDPMGQYKTEHSLTKPYPGNGGDFPNWDIQGSTNVTSERVRLTSDVLYKQGSIWNSAPVKMTNWEVQVEIKVHGKGDRLYGDGMAFWYVRDRMTSGVVYGSTDYFTGIGVIVNEYSSSNKNRSHISALVNNGSRHYDPDDDVSDTLLPHCEIKTKLRNSGNQSWLAIRYESEVLTVGTDMSGGHVWSPCLRVEGVKLPTGYYFGLSASTGDLSDNHDVITVRTFDLGGGGALKYDHIDQSTESHSTLSSTASISNATTLETTSHHHLHAKSDWSLVKTVVITGSSILVFIVFIVVGIILFQAERITSTAPVPDSGLMK